MQEVVWEKLRDVHGNNEFARADFTCLNDRNESTAMDTTGLTTGSFLLEWCQIWAFMKLSYSSAECIAIL